MPRPILVPCICLVAAGLAGAAASQEPGAASPRLEAPWDTIHLPLAEPRFKVEAVRFKARDETGADWLGSDEVMVEIWDAKGASVTDEIGGINSGDVHEFDPAVSCIIGVPEGRHTLGKDSPCDPRGEPGPFSFEVIFWEKDDVTLDFGFCVVVGPPPGLHSGHHCGNDGRGDDFIGRRELFFPAPELVATLPNVGDTYTETVVLSPCEDGVSACGGWDLPDYSFTYRTTRLPDLVADFGAQLAAAMERTGAITATAAVASGLASLKAPVDRGAEAEAAPAAR